MKSLVKRPLPAHTRYIQFRCEEFKGLYKLTPSEVVELMLDEWRNLSEDEKLPYLNAAKEERDDFNKKWREVEAVGVDSFMKTIKEKRQENEIDSEFQEDPILAIINHKRNWKKTWGKKRILESKRKNGNFCYNGRKKMKLKLN
ncbi:unnamed protein product [Blepharisma stoltei]|uniref:HMG box domain-containing protein n=1 Tax=Blepharisma stoltei TaxID=1481888 RepID=A0AAU9JNL5_9CILI|nr:unnamed protein product [Blepharisma stoltei]